MDGHVIALNRVTEEEQAAPATVADIYSYPVRNRQDHPLPDDDSISMYESCDSRVIELRPSLIPGVPEQKSQAEKPKKSRTFPRKTSKSKTTKTNTLLLNDKGPDYVLAGKII